MGYSKVTINKENKMSDINPSRGKAFKVLMPCGNELVGATSLTEGDLVYNAGAKVTLEFYTENIDVVDGALVVTINAKSVTPDGYSLLKYVEIGKLTP